MQIFLWWLYMVFYFQASNSYLYFVCIHWYLKIKFCQNFQCNYFRESSLVVSHSAGHKASHLPLVPTTHRPIMYRICISLYLYLCKHPLCNHIHFRKHLSKTGVLSISFTVSLDGGTHNVCFPCINIPPSEYIYATKILRMYQTYICFNTIGLDKTELHFWYIINIF